MTPGTGASIRTRIVLSVGALALLAAAGTVDVVAAALVVALIVSALVVLRRKDRGGERRAWGLVFFVVTGAALVCALTLPAYRDAPSALVVAEQAATPDVGLTPPGVTGGSGAGAPRAKSGALVPCRGAPRGPKRCHAPVKPSPIVAAPTTTTTVAPAIAREVMGFAESDADDTASGVDAAAKAVTTVAATGLQLGAVPGTVVASPTGDVLPRAHLSGAGGLLLLQNVVGNDFDGSRGLGVIAQPGVRGHVVEAVRAIVDRDHWDGVVLDLEQLPAAARAPYVALTREMQAALGDRTVAVAVPAYDDPNDPDQRGYDLAGLGDAADRLIWMAYDQHSDTDAPGPVAGLPWVKSSLGIVLGSVPAAKVLLGVAGYGYAWKSIGVADEVTVPEAKALAGAPGAQMHFDATQNEWGGRTADGRELWYQDATGAAARAQVAADLGLAGVALWRLGSEEPGTVSRLPFPVARPYAAKVAATPLPDARPVSEVAAKGVVALTFDDGPDPTWTPQVLAILAREHVPATFFLVGKNAQAHQDLVRQEVAAGHVVGGHTFSHPNMGQVPEWEQRAQIQGGAWVIEGITGRKPLLFRAPYGEGDSAPGRRGADELATTLGFHPEGWTDDPADWSRPGTDVIAKRVVEGAGVRTVVLLHDGGGDRSETIAALPHIIETLRAQGYSFTTVDQVDANVTTPYLRRGTVRSRIQGAAIVAAFRIEIAVRRLVVWILLGVAALAIIRTVGCGALAVAHRSGRRRHRSRHAAHATTSPDPFTVTVLVPAYNEAAVMAKTINALAALDPSPAKILVIDDGSTDATATIAEGLMATVPGLHVVRQANAGKAAALNHGISLTTTAGVVVIDADTVVDPGFLAAVIPHFADPNVGAVAGNVKVGNRRSLLSAMQSLEYIVSLNIDKRAQAVLGIVGIVPGAAGAFRTQALRDAGGYQSDTLVEDADLTVTLLRSGWQICYEDQAVTRTEAPERLAEVIKQRRRWCFGTVEVAAKHAPALLDARAGRAGMILLPWQLTTQVILPLLGPLADLYLLYLLAVHQTTMAAAVLAAAIIADLVLAFVAVALDDEAASTVLLAPLVRFIWRPLQLLVLARAARRWAIGRKENWHPLRRTNSVPAPPRRTIADVSTARTR